MRAAAFSLVLVLAACSSSAPPDAAGGADWTPGAPPPAGLSASQADQLRGLGVPVLVPDVGDAYRLSVFAVNQYGAGADYRLSYERADGACFEVSGAVDGFGSPEWPLVSIETRGPGLPGQPTVRVYQAADDPLATSAQVWGVGTVVSDFIEVDGMTVLFLSDTQGGCRPVTLEEGVEIVSGLRLLTAAGEALAAPAPEDGLGTFVRAEDVLDRYNSGSSPEAAALALADRYEAARVTTDVLEEAGGEAVVLVTALGLADDSVRDERLQLIYRDNGVGTWELVDAGRQVRCWSGRGHEDWGPDPCL